MSTVTGEEGQRAMAHSAVGTFPILAVVDASKSAVPSPQNWSVHGASLLTTDGLQLGHRVDGAGGGCSAEGQLGTVWY